MSNRKPKTATKPKSISAKRRKELSKSLGFEKMPQKAALGIIIGEGKDISSFLGIRDTKKVSEIFAEIDAHEKAAEKLVLQTAKAYYNAGNILANAIRNFNYKAKGLTAKAIADASGFSERRITIALKIFKHFENNPDALNGLTLRESLKLIAPPPAAGEDGLNRVDLGGSAGQMSDYGHLFELPATGNLCLQNYRTVGTLLSDIIVVKRTGDGSLISKCFAHFGEDVPQDPVLNHAYITMSQKTQAAVEDYLAALEQSEQSSRRQSDERTNS